ncbi:MAG: hypothetical protein WCP08_03345 [Prolixibacteraceae bacterium]
MTREMFEKQYLKTNSPKTTRWALCAVLLCLTLNAFSQKTESTGTPMNISGAASVTNNGISFIPTFSLGKPAAIFDLSVGNDRLSFDPQFRFSLEGKPWSFIFWGRYKLLKDNKFTLNLGTHLGLPFSSATTKVNGITAEYISVRRYLAGELVPNYRLSKDVSIGIYYLYSRGIDDGTTKNTHFLTLNTRISNIRMTNQFYLNFVPQVYYLKMDKQDGIYFTSTLTLANRNLPLSISGVINKIIETDITASKNFVWNLSLIYTFRNRYVKQ